jgi:hypothetical protein
MQTRYNEWTIEDRIYITLLSMQSGGCRYISNICFPFFFRIEEPGGVNKNDVGIFLLLQPYRMAGVLKLFIQYTPPEEEHQGIEGGGVFNRYKAHFYLTSPVSIRHQIE